MSFLQDEAVVKGLFGDIAPRFAARNGGYTRIVPTRQRMGDAAPMAVVELIERQKKEAAPAKTEAKKKSA
jgi:large subunit ribosomal protein L17